MPRVVKSSLSTSNSKSARLQSAREQPIVLASSHLTHPRPLQMSRLILFHMIRHTRIRKGMDRNSTFPQAKIKWITVAVWRRDYFSLKITKRIWWCTTLITYSSFNFDFTVPLFPQGVVDGYSHSSYGRNLYTMQLWAWVLSISNRYFRSTKMSYQLKKVIYRNWKDTTIWLSKSCSYSFWLRNNLILWLGI